MVSVDDGDCLFSDFARAVIEEHEEYSSDEADPTPTDPQEQILKPEEEYDCEPFMGVHAGPVNLPPYRLTEDGRYLRDEEGARFWFVRSKELERELQRRQDVIDGQATAIENQRKELNATDRTLKGWIQVAIDTTRSSAEQLVELEKYRVPPDHVLSESVIDEINRVGVIPEFSYGSRGRE